MKVISPIKAARREGLDPYQVLGLPPKADARACKLAYRRKALACHPDHHHGDGQEIRLVNRAWEILSDPDLKEQWDCLLDGQRAPWPPRPASPPPRPPRSAPRGGIAQLELEEVEAWLLALLEELVALAWCEPVSRGGWRVQHATGPQRALLGQLRLRLARHLENDPFNQAALLEASTRDDLRRGATSDLITLCQRLGRRPWPRVATTPPGGG